jgi:hypothetical protein
MARDLVLHDGQLAERIVTESHQPIELGQLEVEVATRQEALDTLQSQVEALATQVSEAQAALADSKSDLSVGSGLVGQPAGDAAGEPTNDDGSVPVDVTVADSTPQL